MNATSNKYRRPRATSTGGHEQRRFSNEQQPTPRAATLEGHEQQLLLQRAATNATSSNYRRPRAATTGHEQQRFSREEFHPHSPPSPTFNSPTSRTPPSPSLPSKLLRVPRPREASPGATAASLVLKMGDRPPPLASTANLPPRTHPYTAPRPAYQPISTRWEIAHHHSPPPPTCHPAPIPTPPPAPPTNRSPHGSTNEQHLLRPRAAPFEATSSDRHEICRHQRVECLRIYGFTWHHSSADGVTLRLMATLFTADGNTLHDGLKHGGAFPWERGYNESLWDRMEAHSLGSVATTNLCGIVAAAWRTRIPLQRGGPARENAKEWRFSKGERHGAAKLFKGDDAWSFDHGQATVSMEAHSLGSVATTNLCGIVAAAWRTRIPLQRGGPARENAKEWRFSKGERHGAAKLFKGDDAWSFDHGQATVSMEAHSLGSVATTNLCGIVAAAWRTRIPLQRGGPARENAKEWRFFKGERHGAAKLFKGDDAWSFDHGQAIAWRRIPLGAWLQRISVGSWLPLGERASPCSAADLQGRTPRSGGSSRENAMELRNSSREMTLEAPVTARLLFFQAIETNISFSFCAGMEAHSLGSVATTNLCGIVAAAWRTRIPLQRGGPARENAKEWRFSKGERHGAAKLFKGDDAWSFDHGQATVSMEAHSLGSVATTNLCGIVAAAWRTRIPLQRGGPARENAKEWRFFKGERHGAAKLFKGDDAWSFDHGQAIAWRRIPLGAWLQRISVGSWLPLGERASPCSAADLQGRTPRSGGSSRENAMELRNSSREMTLEAPVTARLLSDYGQATAWRRIPLGAWLQRISVGSWLPLGERASPCSAADLQGRTPRSGGSPRENAMERRSSSREMTLEAPISARLLHGEPPRHS
ncbi:unnamed protein product [Closterium sp. Yama58-4]|nr:unnamed protein product [Closterium sp. Yama58-4]